MLEVRNDQRVWEATWVNVSAEVWFPALMVLAGVLVANLITFVIGELNFRRDQRTRRNDLARQNLVELQEILNNVFWDLIVFHTTMDDKGYNLGDSRESIKSLLDVIARFKFLAARVTDEETRRWADDVILALQKELLKVADIMPKENIAVDDTPPWDRVAGKTYGGTLEVFNEQVRKILQDTHVWFHKTKAIWAFPRRPLKSSDQLAVVTLLKRDGPTAFFCPERPMPDKLHRIRSRDPRQTEYRTADADLKGMEGVVLERFD